jgi:hypothetical protein
MVAIAYFVPVLLFAMVCTVRLSYRSGAILRLTGTPARRGA